MNFTDAVTVSGTRRTADGYLVAEAKSVRTGVQIYAGHEVGKPEMETVKVYRPADQVFAQDSLQSFTHAPVTMNHPDEAVTADNWKQLAVGEVSTAAKKDGEWVHLPLILKDAAAIQAVETGKRELSAGYTCELVWGDGTTPSGDKYDATQMAIKINHLAIVDKARAGSQARIGDGAISWGASPFTNDQKPREEKIMTLKTVTVDGIPVEVTDQGATVINTLLQRLADSASKLTAADKDHDDKVKAIAADHAAVIVEKDKALATKDADIAKKDAEIDSLKGKVLDAAAIDKLVAGRATLVAMAKAIANDVKTEGLTDAEIRKATVVAKLGDTAVKDKSEAYVDARFDVLAEDAAKGGSNDPFANVVKDGLSSSGNSDKVVTDAYASMVADMKAGKTSAMVN